MKQSGRFWILIFLLMVFICGGFYGMIVNIITQTDIASKKAWWFLIPSIPIAVFYAYKSTFAYNDTIKFWKNLFGAIVSTAFYTLILVKSFQGYLCIYNCNFGVQKDFMIKGFINYVQKPKYTGRLLSLFTIDLTLDSSLKKIKLDTQVNSYEAGQRLDIQAKIGSLGYIYLPK